MQKRVNRMNATVLKSRARILKERRKGFTLVELIVVIVILGILAGIAVPALTGYIEKAQEQQAVSEARDTQRALQTMGTEIMVHGGNLNELAETTWNGSTHLAEVPWEAYPATGGETDVGDVIDTLTGSTIWNRGEGSLDNIRIITFSTSGQLILFYFKGDANWVEWTPAGGYKVLTPQEVEDTGYNLYA
jgi:prepilin-type N-terminal cleavage/methylation domain-containing protein